MLRQVDALTKCSVRATDGAIGRVTDAYFDDQQWAVRYLVVDTGMWLGWHVLISPQSITALDWDGGTIDVALTRDQVERSPRADLQHPLSRLYESEFYTHFGYPRTGMRRRRGAWNRRRPRSPPTRHVPRRGPNRRRRLRLASPRSSPPPIHTCAVGAR